MKVTLTHYREFLDYWFDLETGIETLRIDGEEKRPEDYPGISIRGALRSTDQD